MVSTLTTPHLVDANTIRPVRIGVIGFGYWGPNLARNIAGQPETQLIAIADRDEARLVAAREAHPFTRLSRDHREILDDPEIEAVAIATPAASHAELARQSLEAGKHVLVEKPLATNVADAEDLVALAKRRGLTLAVDHTFLFTGAVRRMKQSIESGELGDLYYYDSTRINLGLFDHETNVIWDLAPHDLSIMLHLIDEPIESVSAVGACHLHHRVENIAYITVRFAKPLLAHFHVNWLAPAKVRKTIVGGSRKMLVFDDMEASEKLKIYDAGADVPETAEEVYRSLVEYRTGDVLAPKLEKTEALAVETSHFAQSIRTGTTPISDGALGLRVVKLIDAAQRSLGRGGVPVGVSL